MVDHKSPTIVSGGLMASDRLLVDFPAPQPRLRPTPPEPAYLLGVNIPGIKAEEGENTLQKPFDPAQA